MTSSASRKAWSIWVRSSSSRARSTSPSPPAASTPNTCEIHHTRAATFKANVYAMEFHHEIASTGELSEERDAVRELGLV